MTVCFGDFSFIIFIVLKYSDMCVTSTPPVIHPKIFVTRTFLGTGIKLWNKTAKLLL